MLRVSSIAVLVSFVGICNAMDLERAFNDITKGEIQWNKIVEKSKKAAQNKDYSTVIDVESAYGGGDYYNADVVCRRALEGDKVAQYSLYRHMQSNFNAYMLLAISASFGKFDDSIEEAESVGLDLKGVSNFENLREKVKNFAGI